MHQSNKKEVYSKESEWKNQDEQYRFELQKFLDIVENVKDEELRKEIIYQMLKCDKRITQIEENIFDKLKKDER